MRIYVVSEFEDIYGVFSTLENAKRYVRNLVIKDIYNHGDFPEPYYSVDSFELDKEHEFSDEIPKLELEVDGIEDFLEMIADNNKEN